MEESSKDKEELSAVRDLPSPVDLAWANKEEENCLGNTIYPGEAL